MIKSKSIKHLLLAICAFSYVLATTSLANAGVIEERGWTLDTDTGEFHLISNSSNYNVSSGPHPEWTMSVNGQARAKLIKKVIVESTVSKIGSYSFGYTNSVNDFMRMTNLKTAIISESVMEIGDYAFYSVSSDVYIYGENVLLGANWVNTGVTIHAYPHSTAATYAKNRGINFDALCKHESELVGYKPATCTEDGYTGDKVCSLCGETIKAGSVIQSEGHKWENEYTIDEPATCTEIGLRSKHCSACEERTNVETLPALGHKWNVSYIWAKDNKSAVAVKRCERDALHMELETATVSIKTTKAPSYNTNGEITYTATFKDPDFKIQTKTVEIPAKGYAPGADPNQKGTDGTAVGPGASAAAADKAITSLKKETDPKGAVFSKLRLKSTSQTKTSVKIAWAKVSGAKKYVIYGNACGTKNKVKKLGTATGSSKNFTKIAGKKVKNGTYYKFIVVALDKNNNVVSTSKMIHVATKGGKYTNHKSVKVSKKVITKAKKLKKGKSLSLKAKAVKVSKKTSKKHVAMRYESTNKKIATVSSKGVVKAKKKGSCYVYAYAQNGVAKKIKITVK